MTHLSAAASDDMAAPPRKPKRTSEQADPADLVQQEYEEPSENEKPSPGKPGFDEPSESPNDTDEFQEPA